MKRPIPNKATLRLELVECGKPKCKRLHGPYWYAYYQGKSGRTIKVYIGKRLPEEVAKRRLRERRRKRGSAHDRKVVQELEVDGDDEDTDR